MKKVNLNKLLEENDRWILPNNLLKQEENQADEKGSLFHAYKNLNSGIETESVNHHACTDSLKANLIVKQVNLVLEKIGSNVSGNLIDIGHGPGTITNEFNIFQNINQIVGIDISKDAISFAKKNYSKHLFLCSSLEDLSLKTKFDIAYCSSFYPFCKNK